MKQLLLRLVGTGTAVQGEVAVLRRDTEACLVKIDNAPRRNHNLQAAANHELMPVAVESVAAGAPPLGTMPPPGLFPNPFTKNSLYSLTGLDITPIRDFYRYPQAAGATVEERRQELLRFLGVVLV